MRASRTRREFCAGIRIVVTALVIAGALAACQGNPGSPPSPKAVGEPGEAILLRTATDDGRLHFLVAGAAGERDMGHVSNPVADVREGWIRAAVANESGLAAFVAEGPDDVRRLLVYDLDSPSEPVHEAPGPPWYAVGPRGLLAVGEPDGESDDPRAIVVHDFANAGSSPRTVAVPDGVRVMGFGAADAGLYAARLANRPEFGVLAYDGRFGTGGPLLVTGLEQVVGPDGQILGFAHGDGNGWSSNTILEMADGDSGEVWYESRTDRDEPEPIGIAWDPTGSGLWMALQADDEIRLALLAGPRQPTVVATLPLPSGGEEIGPPTIIGIRPDGGTVALGVRGNGEGAEFGPAARTFLVDTADGTVTEHDAGFVGWAAWGAAP